MLIILTFYISGVFMFGPANMYRSEYFMDHDVVFVTLNID